MPIIYTYPTLTPNSDSLLLLTDVSDSSKATKTAAISSLLNLGSTGIISKKTTISSAELLNLQATAKEIIPAPGAGKALQIVGPVYAKYNANTTLYAGTSTFFYVNMGASGGGTINFGIVTGTTNACNWDIQASNKDSWGENLNFKIYPNGTITTGDGTLDIYVNYRTITL